MPQQHLDRLNPVDVTFLHLEDDGPHMHIGGVAVMAGPPPGEREFLEHVARRLPLVPRFRQRLAHPPLRSGRPVWVDDPTFNLGYHVRRTAIPAPGGEAELRTLVGRVVSQRLDRTKPLWELWVVEGLPDGRFAFISKAHHALVDGVGGVDLLSVMFDLTPDGGHPADAPPPPWQAQEAPSSLRLAGRVLGDAVRNAAGVAGSLASTLTSPRRLAEQAGDLGGAAVEAARALTSAAPATPLNATPGPHRRWVPVRTELSDLRLVKDSLGGTVNDVVLCVVAEALHDFLERRGFATDGVTLRACVPMSIRSADRAGAMGNEITMMLAPLPVGPMPVTERLAEVARSMRAVKSSKQAVSARLLTQMEYFAPPTVMARAARLGFSDRLYNLLVTNVPGPQLAAYMLGRELLEVFPVAFLAPRHLVAVAVLSYHGAVNFGLIGDYDQVPDLDALADDVETALARLVERARGRRREPLRRG